MAHRGDTQRRSEPRAAGLARPRRAHREDDPGRAPPDHQIRSSSTSRDRRIATLLPVPDHVDGVLYAGVPQDAAIIATDVTGLPGMTQAPSQLAYTTIFDDELQIGSEGNGKPELVARAVGIDRHVEAWGDWGFAVQDDVRRRNRPVHRLRRDQRHEGRRDPRFRRHRLACHRQPGSEPAQLWWRGHGPGAAGPSMGKCSPVGSQMAATARPPHQRAGLRHVRRERSIDVDRTLGLGVPQLAWSSDGRFVAYPGPVAYGSSTQCSGETMEICRTGHSRVWVMLPVADS